VEWIFKTKNEFGQNPEENIILTKILTGSLTKTNKDNIIVKYNICKCNSQKYLIIPNSDFGSKLTIVI
jgi:DeoR/GlpR family transcriptional regulator of sugar metabolism